MRELILCATVLFFCSCSEGPKPSTDTGQTEKLAPTQTPKDGETPMTDSKSGFYGLSVRSLAGESVSLAEFKGRVSLVVNVASACGYTPQYAGLQKLHEEFQDRGFQVLAFPCNDFGGQEPGSPQEIRAFCDSRYKVSFPLFEKVSIKGSISPVYANLIEQSEKTPSWNFCKYLVGKDGKVLSYHPSGTRPDDPALRAAIEQAL